MQFCSIPNCKFPNFSIDKVTRLPYCRNHQTKRTDFDRRTIIQRAMAKEKALSSKVRSLGVEVSKKENSNDVELDLWFRYMAIEMAKRPWCEECGAWIPPNFYRSATAHILPKKKEYGFPSVSTHPKNVLFLGAGCGCHNKTHRWDKFSKMKVWPLAVAAFKEIYPFIAEEEKKNIPQILLDTLT